MSATFLALPYSEIENLARDKLCIAASASISSFCVQRRMTSEELGNCNGQGNRMIRHRKMFDVRQIPVLGVVCFVNGKDRENQLMKIAPSSSRKRLTRCGTNFKRY